MKMKAIVALLCTSLCANSFLGMQAMLADAWLVPNIPSSWKIRTSQNVKSSCTSEFLLTLQAKVSDLYENEDEGIYDHLRDEFHSLSKGKSEIDFQTFFHWPEIQALVADQLISVEEIEDMYKASTPKKSLESSLDVQSFIEVNRKIDDMFEIDEEDEEYEGEFYDEDEEKDDEIGEILEGKVEEIVEDQTYEDFDVWDNNVDANQIFQPEFISYLSSYFDEHSVDGLITYKTFFNWNDVQEMIKEGNVDSSSIRELWLEALQYESVQNPDSTDTSMLSERENRRRSFEERGISFDTFIRMNFRLEEMIEDIREALEHLSENDIDDYYRKEFALLTQHTTVLTYEKFLKWNVVQELLEHNDISIEKLDVLWAGTPKLRFDGYTGTGLTAEDREGIDVDAFITLNNAINDSIGVDGGLNELQ